MAFPLRIQQTTGTTGASFPTTLTTSAFGSTTKAGSLIIVALMADGLAANQTFTMTDSAGNTYTRLVSNSSAGLDQVDIWACYNNKSGASHTITGGNLQNTTAAIIAEEWTGVMNIADTINAQSLTGASTAVSTGALTPQSTAGLVFVACAINSSAITYTVGGGFSNLTSVTSSPSKLATESKIMSGGGAQTGTMTLSSGNDWFVCMVVIPENGGSPGAPYIRVGDGMSRSEVAN